MADSPFDALEEFVTQEVVEKWAAFDRWLKKTIGLSDRFLDGINIGGTDDDWTFVIKLHAMLEAALNHLLIAHFNRPELESVFPLMDNSDIKRGKMAFVIRLGLLPDRLCAFIQCFSQLRNFMVHDVKHFDFNLIEYPKFLKSGRLKWLELIASGFGFPPTGNRKDDAGIAELCAQKNPRRAIRSLCMEIMECILTATNPAPSPPPTGGESIPTQ